MMFNSKVTGPKLSEILPQHGKDIWLNTFETPRGVYTIEAYVYDNSIYLMKKRNNAVVEIINLTTKAKVALQDG